MTPANSLSMDTCWISLGKKTDPDNCKGKTTMRWNCKWIDRQETDILRITLHCVFYEYAGGIQSDRAVFFPPRNAVHMIQSKSTSALAGSNQR